jgi:stage II sporulation protein D
VAGEAAADAPPAALEALAVTARTFAVANVGRHGSEGFDLCDLTHCQALRPATPASRAAAAATAGRILVYGGRPAEVYYSASCGGRSARPAEIWRRAAPDPPYLVSREEPGCREASRWSAEIRARDLQRALRAAGLRGEVLRDLRVAARTASGRVARVRVDGFEPGEISGEAFRLAVGRALGWNLVRSHLFDVRRTAAGYRFTGTGFGHGVGLCVMGASRLGRAGRSAGEILGTYFPGAVVAAPAPAIQLELAAADEPQRAAVFALVEQGLRDLEATTGEPAPARVVLRFHPTVESFRRATGRPWWVGGAARGDRIDLLPVSALAARGILRRTVRHELAHLFIDPALSDRPLWAREGLAQVFAGEATPRAAVSAVCPDDAAMRGAASADQMRDAYARAAACAARALAAGQPWRDVGK